MLKMRRSVHAPHIKAARRRVEAHVHSTLSLLLLYVNKRKIDHEMPHLPREFYRVIVVTLEAISVLSWQGTCMVAVGSYQAKKSDGFTVGQSNSITATRGLEVII